MGKFLHTIPVDDLMHDTENILKLMKKCDDPFFITKNGHAAAVIIGVDAFEKSEKEKSLLRLLLKGNRDIETAQGVDLDSVLAEADILLDQDIP